MVLKWGLPYVLMTQISDDLLAIKRSMFLVPSQDSNPKLNLVSMINCVNHIKVTLSELKQQQQNVVAERERQIALKLQEDKKKSEEEMKRKKKEKKRLKKYQNKNKISFGDDEEIVEGLLL